MPNTFNPPKQENKTTMEITVKELNLIKLLRGVSFGKVVVQKMNGQLVRVETSVSTLLEDKEK